MEATMNVRIRSQNVEAAWLDGDLELSENVGRNTVVHTLDRSKDVSSDCTVQATMEEDYKVMMGFVDNYVCAFCDEGDKLIRCDGDCRRYFHPTKLDGEYSKCETLGLSEEQVKQLPFMCKNCEYKQHQCVVCGGLDPSAISSDFNYIAVLQCSKKGCRRFYHPECLDRVDTDLNRSPQDYECPLHECWSCKKKGKKVAGKHATPEGNERAIETRATKATGMNLVQCRRCPKAYHKKCLPRRDLCSRTWVTSGRILFYCHDHKIVKRLRSAKRGHLKFPEAGVENGTSLQGASKKRSVPEAQVEHANKESDPVSENRDKIPKTHKGNPTPEQAK